MNRKLILFLFAVLGLRSLPSAAQSHLSGFWTGYITQSSPLALASVYTFSLSAEIRNGELTGYTEIRLKEDPETYGVMIIRGTAGDETLDFTELKISEQQISYFAYWCLKRIRLRYSVESGKEVLRGHWENATCSGPGEVYLERAPSV